MSAELRNAQRTIYLQGEEIEALKAQLEHEREENSRFRRIVQEQDSCLDVHRHGARQRLLSLAADYDGRPI